MSRVNQKSINSASDGSKPASTVQAKERQTRVKQLISQEKAPKDRAESEDCMLSQGEPLKSSATARFDQSRSSTVQSTTGGQPIATSRSPTETLGSKEGECGQQSKWRASELQASSSRVTSIRLLVRGTSTSVEGSEKAGETGGPTAKQFASLVDAQKPSEKVHI